MIAISGASGRTDAAHATLLAAHAAVAVDKPTMLLMRDDVLSPKGAGTLRVIKLVNPPAIEVLARVADVCAREGRLVFADLPPDTLTDPAIRGLIDFAVLAVGRHEADERDASDLARRCTVPTWHLGCGRAGGTPAAERFAAAMAAYDPTARVLAYAMPPLGRGEATELAHSPPRGRTLGLGLRLLAAIHLAADTPEGDRTMRSDAELAAQAERLAAAPDERSLADRLRELADDLAAAEAGFVPSVADLAGAPVLDAWDYGIVPARVLIGTVTGHPDIADGRSARTSEVYLTDRSTYARTLSRWYVLRAPAGAAAPGLQ
ncbi:DUF6634 family protein [Methylobacterium mesophilicum]